MEPRCHFWARIKAEMMGDIDGGVPFHFTERRAGH